MTLNNLLEEIKYGSEFVEERNKIGDLKTFINEETGGLLISKRAEALLKECDNSISYIKKLSRAARNYKEYEDKIEEGTSVSPIYARMKVDSISDDINSALLELENKKLLKESNQEVIGKVISILKHGLDNISKSKKTPLKNTRTAPGLIESYSKKETSLIESII